MGEAANRKVQFDELTRELFVALVARGSRIDTDENVRSCVKQAESLAVKFLDMRRT